MLAVHGVPITIPRNLEISGIDSRKFPSGLTPAFQPRRFMIAPAADGCERLLGGGARTTVLV